MRETDSAHILDLREAKERGRAHAERMWPRMEPASRIIRAAHDAWAKSKCRTLGKNRGSYTLAYTVALQERIRELDRELDAEARG